MRTNLKKTFDGESLHVVTLEIDVEEIARYWDTWRLDQLLNGVQLAEMAINGEEYPSDATLFAMEAETAVGWQN